MTSAARVAGVRCDDVTVHVPLLGGGFGRRLEVDYVAQAVRVAMDAGGAPVQLLWPREEDTTHDFYRPMQVAMLRATLDAAGQWRSLRIKTAGDAITPRWLERAMPRLAGPIELPDKTTAEGLFDLPYGVAHQHMEHVATRSRRAGRLLALRGPFPQRVLRGVVRRRARSRGEGWIRWSSAAAG